MRAYIVYVRLRIFRSRAIYARVGYAQSLFSDAFLPCERSVCLHALCSQNLKQKYWIARADLVISEYFKKLEYKLGIISIFYVHEVYLFINVKHSEFYGF